MQAKLAVSRPGDTGEREADRVAEQVIQMRAAPCACGGDCPSCRDHAALRIQRSALPAGSGGLAVPDDHVQTLGNGQPLDATLRGYFEPRFGQDFSDVRVHTDVRAAAAAENLGALAYTAGEHIVFGAGQYASQTSAGRKLIAHELTHVVQQGSMGPGPQAIQRACGPAAIGTPTGCVDHGHVFLPGYPTFRFTPNCDEFAPGQQAALVAAVTALPASAQIEIHGYASPSGSAGAAFDRNVSCARALQAQTVLTDPAPAGAGIAPARISGVVSHGPTPGPASGRSVVVITPPLVAPPPATVPAAGAKDLEITGVGVSTPTLLFFAQGESAITFSADEQIRAHRLAPPGTVRLIGFASADEAASVAEDRAKAVEAALIAPAPPADSKFAGEGPVTVSSAVGNAAATAGRADFTRARSVEIVIGNARPSVADCAAKDPKTGALLNPPTQPCAVMDPTTWIRFHFALLIAEDAMKRAVASVSGTPTADDAPVIDRFFGNHSPSTLTTLRKNLPRLQSHVANLPASTQCGAQCDAGGCAEGGYLGYNDGVDAASIMTICVPAFAKRPLVDAARILIHESAHGTSPLGGTPTTGAHDLAYRHDRMLAFLTPSERLRNPDSYALFAIFLRRIQMAGTPIASIKGINTPATDQLDGFGTNLPALRLALARLEKRVTWATDRSADLYGEIGQIRSGSLTWAAARSEDTMREAAARFPLTAPPALPSLTDQTRVAAIFDRYDRMHDAVKLDLTATPRADGVVEWPSPTAITLFGDAVEIGPDFFRATPADQVALLLEALARATPDVEPAFVPAYVSLAGWIHQQNP